MCAIEVFVWRVEARLLQDRLRCIHLLLKSPSFLVIQIKVAQFIFRICKDYVYLCALRITTKRCAFKQTGCALGLM